MASAILGQIICFLFAAALVALAFKHKDVKSATRMMSVFCSFCLVIIGAVGPQSLLSMTFKFGDNEFSLSRYQPTEEEKAEAIRLIASDASVEELEASQLVTDALNRAPEKRSSTDYLLLSQLERQRNEPAKALELAYTGIGISQDDTVVSGGLKKVIGESFEAVGERKLGKEYQQEAVRVAPVLTTDPKLIDKTRLRQQFRTTEKPVKPDN